MSVLALERVSQSTKAHSSGRGLVGSASALMPNSDEVAQERARLASHTLQLGQVAFLLPHFKAQKHLRRKFPTKKKNAIGFVEGTTGLCFQASDDVVSSPENQKNSKSHKDEHLPAGSSHHAAVSVLFHFKPLRLATIRSAAGKRNPAYNDATPSFSGFDCRNRNMTSPKCDESTTDSDRGCKSSRWKGFTHSGQQCLT